MITVIIICTLFLSLLITIWSIYNSLVRASNSVKEAFSWIDIQLKKRYEMIPSLVSSLKGYMTYETTLLEKIVEQRSDKSHSFLDTVANDKSVSSTLKKIRVQVESYPDLKADVMFLELLGSLSSVENELSMARRYYNGTCTDFNNKLEVFPNVLLAKIMGFTRADYYEIDENEKLIQEINIIET